MKVVIAFVCLFILYFSSVAQAQLHAYGTAARVNGVDISNSTLERNFEEYQRENKINIAAIRYPNRVTMMRREVLDRLIDQEILWQAAQEHELTADSAEVDEALQLARAQFTSELNFKTRLATEGFTIETYREHIRQMLSGRKYLTSVTSNIGVSDADIHDFYAANPDKFQLPEAVRARHILLKLTAQADEETRSAVYDKAGSLMERLAAGEDFAAIAIEESQDSSAAQGGDLGYFPRGKMVEPFEDAVFALEAGELSGIVESPFGLHIIMLEDHQAAQTVPEELAKERITEHLLQVKSQQLVTKEISDLRTAASIEVLAAQ